MLGTLAPFAGTMKLIPITRGRNAERRVVLVAHVKSYTLISTSRDSELNSLPR